MEPTHFIAQVERDHVHMTVTVSGSFAADDAAAFTAALEEASRGRRREWTIDALRFRGDGAAFVESLTWLRSKWGHVCVLNPPADLRAAVAAADPDQRLVVRSDSRADT